MKLYQFRKISFLFGYSAKIGRMEDLEDMKREEEELKRKAEKKKMMAKKMKKR